MSNSLSKIMVDFKFICDAAGIELVKLGIKMQRYSFIYEVVSSWFYQSFWV